MVDLDNAACVKSTPVESEEAIQEIPNPYRRICRLCLQEDNTEPNKSVNIFEEPQTDAQGNKTKSIEDLLYELFSIKYDKTFSSMPDIICQRCWEMVQAFNKFRCLVQQCEELLQKRLKLLETNAFVSGNEENRPGLNGNPGVFIPDEDCEIEEVNPEQDIESSEDDFSMESDTEPDDVLQSTKASEPSAVSRNPNVLKPAVNIIPIYNSSSNINDVEPTKSKDLNMSKEIAPGNVQTENVNLEFTIKNTYTCQYCDMAFTALNECTEHESLHDPSAPFFCNFCHMRCGSRQTLIGHIKESHDPERPYICALCSKGFCRRSDLKKHSIVHTGVRPFVCPICAKSFSRNTNLTKHMRIHSSIKPYVCQQCPRSFTTGLELSRHARTHTETRAFKCSKCPATYARKDKLHIHEQSHYRKEADFLLNTNKQLQNIQQNQSQMRTNTENAENLGQPINPYNNADINQTRTANTMQQQIFTSNQVIQKPFAQNKPTPPPKASHGRIHNCDICNKSFTRERDLHRHQALHLDTLFTCKQCGLGFSRREKLARHELEHHAPQYACDICRITFHKTEELEMHLKMHELQQNAALSAHQAVLNAAGVVHAPTELNQIQHQLSVSQTLQQPQPPPLPPVVPMAVQRPSVSDMSFYSNMVPTMNLGFYSETRPEDRNGI